MGVQDKLRESRGIPNPTPQQETPPSENEESETNDSEDESVKPTKNFEVIFSHKEWKKLEPKIQLYERRDRPGPRKRLLLPQFDWEDIIVHVLWEQHKLPCTYTFESGYATSALDRQQFIKIKAHCRECGATAIGIILTEPANGAEVPMTWTANDTRGLSHIHALQIKVSNARLESIYL